MSVIWDLLNRPVPFLDEYAPVFYGLAVLIVVALAFAGDRTPTLLLSALMLVDFGAWNLTIGVWGYSKAPLFLPIEQAIWGGVAAILFVTTKERAARTVMLLFAAGIVIWLGFIWNHQQYTHACYLVANMVFFARVMVTGVTGARDHARRSRDDGRLSLRPADHLFGGGGRNLVRTAGKKTTPHP